MAHLWTQDPDGSWVLSALAGSEFMLTGDAALPLRIGSTQQEREEHEAILLRRQDTTAEAWVLMASPRSNVRINGTPVAPLGIRVLMDRDEICVNGTRLFFSTEKLARVEPFPGAHQPVSCPRCKQEIFKDTLAVQCPQCGVWHHQTDDLPCWTYSERCALCDQPTALDAGFRWTPEEL